MDPVLKSFCLELTKVAFKMPGASQIEDFAQTTAKWGKKFGKAGGAGSTAAGFNTVEKSFGIQSLADQAQKTAPKLPGTPEPPTSFTSAMPSPKATVNNQVNLRRGLSNIQTPTK